MKDINFLPKSFFDIASYHKKEKAFLLKHLKNILCNSLPMKLKIILLLQKLELIIIKNILLNIG